MYQTNKYFLLLLLLPFSFSFIQAQDELPNGGMENWVAAPLDLYEDPAPIDFWVTANKVATLGGDVTTMKTTEMVYSGTYAAKLVTGLLTELPITGTISSGNFDTNFSPPIHLGKPFTDRPSHLQGYFAYFPETLNDGSGNLDECAILLQLTKFIDGSQTLIGEAYLENCNETPNYNLFSLPVEYYSNAEPDTIIISFASSRYGQDYIVGVGSTMYIDDIMLCYNTTGDCSVGFSQALMPEISVQTYPNPSNEWVQIILPQALAAATLKVYNHLGQLISQQKIEGNSTTLNTFDLPNAPYFYQVCQHKQILASGKIIVQH